MMNNILKRIIAMLLVCFMIFANCVTFADEVENTEEEVNTPPITDTSIERTYDAKKGVYKYNLSKLTSFTSNVPNGIITNEDVYIDISDKIKFELTKDGENYSYVRGEPLTEDGMYNLKVTTNTSLDFNFNYASSQFSFDSTLYDTHESQIPTDGTAGLITEAQTEGENILTEQPVAEQPVPSATPKEDDLIIHDDETGLPDGTEFNFRFRIITEKCNNANVFNLPVGYAFKSITYNEIEETGVNKLKYYLIEKDGTYTFTIYDKDNPKVEFTTKIVVKREMPVLKLTGVANGLTTYNSVKVEKLTNDTTYDVKLDGEEYTLYSDAFIDAGLYTITAKDDYGNTNEYSFRILYTLNVSSGTVIFLLVVIVVGLFVYTRYLNKHMRVN